tara:strand:- start:80 stop:238 length:159 start_codon:yes stop_codon:yes gene_type:complete
MCALHHIKYMGVSAMRDVRLGWMEMSAYVVLLSLLTFGTVTVLSWLLEALAD